MWSDLKQHKTYNKFPWWETKYSRNGVTYASIKSNWRISSRAQLWVDPTLMKVSDLEDILTGALDKFKEIEELEKESFKKPLTR